MNLIAAIDPATATFVLAILVLVAGVILAIAALRAPAADTTAQQAFAAVGVLFGLLAAGGLGGLFANAVAQDAADASATMAAESATEEVTEQVTELGEQVEDALETPAGQSGPGSGAGAEGK